MNTSKKIDHFVGIYTRIVGHSSALETSQDVSIEEMFDTHLNLPPDAHFAGTGTNLYKFQIGTKIALRPSSHTVQLFEQINQEVSVEYTAEYEIVDIALEYYSQDLKPDQSNDPKMRMIISLKPL